MELSTNKDLDIQNNPDIMIARRDEDYFKEDNKHIILEEDFTQYSTIPKSQAYSNFIFDISFYVD